MPEALSEEPQKPVEVFLNGSRLQADSSAPAHGIYPVSASLLKEKNILALSYKAAPGPRPMITAIFLTRKTGLPRLTSGICPIREPVLKRYSILDLDGPIFVKALSDSEYRNFEEQYVDSPLPGTGFLTIQVPSIKKDFFNLKKDKRFLYELFITPDTLPTRSLALTTDKISGPDEVYLNGTRIGATGIPGDQEKLYYDKTRIYPLPDTLLKAGEPNRINIITSRATPHIYGLLDGNYLRIGYTDKEFKDFAINEIISLSLIAIYFSVGLYFIILLIRTRKNIEDLFFSLFSILLSVYLLLRTQAKYLFFDNFYMLKKVEYLSMQFTNWIPLFSYLLYVLTREFFYYAARKITRKGGGKWDTFFFRVDVFLANKRRFWSAMANRLPSSVSR
ncbi:MAG: hypothetical protein GY754_12405, partial [bacterium]|nr:hypothetical protein [bacterium]